MSKTILVADDSVTIQKVVELTFIEEDYRVVTVADGDEALAQLAELSPDLLIADVHMPGAGGYDVCKRAKELKPEAPVLLLVGAFELFDPEAAESCGADAHLKKPFDSQELQRQVAELLDRPAAAAAKPQPVVEPVAAGGPSTLSDEDVERIAKRVVELLADDTVREVAWEVVPDLAEVVIRDRLQELEGQVE